MCMITVFLFALEVRMSPPLEHSFVTGHLFCLCFLVYIAMFLSPADHENRYITTLFMTQQFIMVENVI